MNYLVFSNAIIETLEPLLATERIDGFGIGILEIELGGIHDEMKLYQIPLA